MAKKETVGRWEGGKVGEGRIEVDFIKYTLSPKNEIDIDFFLGLLI